jgi:methionyl-tRNA formyltransferase
MKVHLITTDVSGFRLLDSLGPELAFSCVIVPENRLNQPKIEAVRNAAYKRNVSVYVHRKGSLFDASLPSANGAISWLYSQIIRTEDLARYPLGALNMHGGFIPKYRGANVLHWAIINGEKELGVTWHQMVEEIDAGTIWAEGHVPITPSATAQEVRTLMIEKGIELFPLAWHNMATKKNGRIPDLSSGTVWPSRRPVDGRIEMGLPARRVCDLVRALCPPWPSAYIAVNGEDVPIVGVRLTPQPESLPYVTAEGETIYLFAARRSNQ